METMSTKELVLAKGELATLRESIGPTPAWGGLKPAERAAMAAQFSSGDGFSASASGAASGCGAAAPLRRRCCWSRVRRARSSSVEAVANGFGAAAGAERSVLIA